MSASTADEARQVEAIVKEGEAAAPENRKPDKLDVIGADPVLSKKIFKVQKMFFPSTESIAKRFPYPTELEHEDEVYWWRDRIIVPRDLREEVLAELWKDMPSSTGRIRLYGIVRERYWGISAPFIEAFLKRQGDHQEHTQRRRSQISKSILPAGPCQQLMVDITFRPGGNQRTRTSGILVLIDIWSKYVWAHRITNREAPQIAKRIEETLKSVPVMPKILRSDNEFKNGAVQDMLARLGVRLICGPSHTPTAQGLIERTNRSIKTIMTSLAGTGHSESGFRKQIREAVQFMNTTPSSVTGFAPESLNSAELPANIVAAVNKKLGVRAKSSQPNKRYQPPLKPGDQVRVDYVYSTDELRKKFMPMVKKGNFPASHHPTFSEQVFTVRRVDKRLNNVYLEDDSYAYPRGKVLLIPKDDAAAEEPE